MLLEPGCESFDAVLELTQRIAHGAQIGWHGRWGLLPVLRGEGKRPAGVGGLRPWFHDVSSQRHDGQTAGRFIAAIGDQVQRKMREEQKAPSAMTCVCHGVLPCDRAHWDLSRDRQCPTTISGVPFVGNRPPRLSAALRPRGYGPRERAQLGMAGGERDAAGHDGQEG
jgi:hypothetical protein